MIGPACCQAFRSRRPSVEQLHGHTLEHELGQRAVTALALESTGHPLFRRFSIEERARAATQPLAEAMAATRLLRGDPPPRL